MNFFLQPTLISTVHKLQYTTVVILRFALRFFFAMAPIRIRLSIQQKVKIIEESKKSGFKREKILIEYGIGKATLSALLKNQKQTKITEMLAINKLTQSDENITVEII